jgi:hypothetical protein
LIVSPALGIRPSVHENENVSIPELNRMFRRSYENSVVGLTVKARLILFYSMLKSPGKGFSRHIAAFILHGASTHH